MAPLRPTVTYVATGCFPDGHLGYRGPDLFRQMHPQLAVRLRLSCLFNDAQWHGERDGSPRSGKAGDRAGVPFKRPPRGPITKRHMRVLPFRSTSPPASARQHDPTRRRASGAAVDWASWYSREPKSSRWNMTLAATRASPSAWSTSTRSWTSTSSGRKQQRSSAPSASQTKGGGADLCRVWAFKNHLAVNHSPPPLTPLFAFREHSVWRPLVKDHFVRTSSALFGSAGLETVFRSQLQDRRVRRAAPRGRRARDHHETRRLDLTLVSHLLETPGALRPG